MHRDLIVKQLGQILDPENLRGSGNQIEEQMIKKDPNRVHPVYFFLALSQKKQQTH